MFLRLQNVLIDLLQVAILIKRFLTIAAKKTKNKRINPYKMYYRNSIYSVAFRFGAITMVSGIIGVPLGTYLTQKLKKDSCRNDPIVCAAGLLISAPLLAGSMLMIESSEPIAYLLVFLGEIALNLNWAIVADILLVRMNFLFRFSFYSHTNTIYFFLFFFAFVIVLFV